jgi:hypothetical protein
MGITTNTIGMMQTAMYRIWQGGNSGFETGNEIKHRTVGEGSVLEKWGTVLKMRTNELIKIICFNAK